MSAKVFFGDVCAYVPGPRLEKANYHRIGAAFRDGDRISIKIDTFPIPQSGWQGWCNIFPRASGSRPPADEPPPLPESDIPF